MRTMAVIAALLAAVGASSQARAQCKNDSMCRAEDVCSGGRCVPRTPQQAPAAQPVPEQTPVAPTLENTAQACSDHIDDDRDGFTDCADQDCFPFAFCSAAGQAAGAAAAPPPRRFSRAERRQQELDAPLVATGETRGITGLIIAGPILFGVTYLITLSVASAAASGRDKHRITNYAAVPLAGPWIWLGSSVDTDNYITPLVMSGIFQMAGVVMTVLGLVIQRPVYRRVPRAQLSPGLALTPSLKLEPAAMGRSGFGLQLNMGSF